MKWKYKRYIHVVLPAILLFLYLLGLLVVMVISLALLPITFINWLIHKKEMKWYDTGPSFLLIEKYWKILAEK